MGIPGWHLGNDQPSFYADPKVFRPAHPLCPIAIRRNTL